jgi:succinate-acetate transporter protein
MIDECKISLLVYVSKLFQTELTREHSTLTLTTHLNMIDINDRVDELERRLNQRKETANLSALGLFAFSLTTAILQVRDISSAQNDASVGLTIGFAFGFGGLVQLLAGLVCAARGQSFGSVAFCSYGGFWISFAIHECIVRTGVVPRSDVAEAAMLFMWGIYTIALFLCSMNTNIAISALFGFLAALFFLLAAAKHSESEAMDIFAAVWGTLTSIVAFYAGFGELMNEQCNQVLIPLGHYNRRNQRDKSFNEARMQP